MPNFYSKSDAQQGFTLIELMIAITLGLLISAAAIALFLGSSRNAKFQDAADDVQDAAVFSLSYLQKEIAMANLGSYQPMTQESPWTGIVLTMSEDGTATAGTAGRKVGNLRGIAVTDKALLSQNAINSSFVNSNVVNSKDEDKSDQLTIQYRAPFDLVDCEGNKRDKGQMVVERIFARQDSVANTGNDSFDIVLACDAGWYDIPPNMSPSDITADTITMNGLGTDSEVLVNRVDYFKVKLGVQEGGLISYIPINEYMAKTGGAYTNSGVIVAVQIGVIARGVDPIGTQTTTTFNVLGDEVTIADTSNQFVRRVYEHTIRLRNARLESSGSNS